MSLDLGNVPILRDIDLAVGKGEVVCVVGPSGVGKSSLLRLLAAVLSGPRTYLSDDEKRAVDEAEAVLAGGQPATRGR